jgi:hypothetical protein
MDTGEFGVALLIPESCHSDRATAREESGIEILSQIPQAATASFGMTFAEVFSKAIWYLKSIGQ